MTQLRSPGNHLHLHFKTVRMEIFFMTIKVSNLEVLINLVFCKLSPYFLSGHSAELLQAFLLLLVMS